MALLGKLDSTGFWCLHRIHCMNCNIILFVILVPTGVCDNILLTLVILCLLAEKQGVAEDYRFWCAELCSKVSCFVNLCCVPRWLCAVVYVPLTVLYSCSTESKSFLLGPWSKTNLIHWTKLDTKDSCWACWTGWTQVHIARDRWIV